MAQAYESGALAARLEDICGRHRVPGVSVAVLEAGGITTAAAGIANIVSGVPLTSDTLMHIGSITKLLNTTLVMQLVDEGRLELDSPLSICLPDLRLATEGAVDAISIRMLLDHSSGIDGEWLPDHGHDEETLERAIGRFAALGQIFPPGTECSYNNVAHVIAGYLAQRVTGTSWYELVRTRIFELLGLQHAEVLPERAILHRASVGHYLDPGSDALMRVSRAFGPLSFAPAGVSAMMSAADLVRFAGAHIDLGTGLNGVRLLSEASARAMQCVSVSNRGKGYTAELDAGLGWFIQDNVLNHAGGGQCVHAILYVCPTERRALAILTNAAHGHLVSREVAEPWLESVGGRPPLGSLDCALPVPPPQVALAEHCGVFEDVWLRHEVTLDTRGLILSTQLKFSSCENMPLDFWQPRRLIPLGEHLFAAVDYHCENPTRFGELDTISFRRSRGSAEIDLLGWGLHLYRRAT